MPSIQPGLSRKSIKLLASTWKYATDRHRRQIPRQDTSLLSQYRVTRTEIRSWVAEKRGRERAHHPDDVVDVVVVHWDAAVPDSRTVLIRTM
eukprot:2031528-Rhodomonas_salina.2